MKIKTISLSFGYTKGMPNYSSVRIDESMEIELEEGDDVEAIKDEQYKILRESVRQKLIAVGGSEKK